MRKLMTLMLGLSLALGAVSISFAEDPPKKEKKAKKKGKKEEGRHDRREDHPPPRSNPVLGSASVFHAALPFAKWPRGVAVFWPSLTPHPHFF